MKKLALLVSLGVLLGMAACQKGQQQAPAGEQGQAPAGGGLGQGTTTQMGTSQGGLGAGTTTQSSR